MRRFPRTALAIALAALALTAAACAKTGASLEGTKWKLSAWSVSSAQATDFPITLEFEAKQLGGKAPVNSYGGTYKVSGSDFSTGDINRTLMAGDEKAMQAEDAYFELLGQAKKYSAEGNTLKLQDSGGNDLLIFTKQ